MYCFIFLLLMILDVYKYISDLNKYVQPILPFQIHLNPVELIQIPFEAFKTL